MALFCICQAGDDTFPNTVLLVDFLELVTSNSSLVSWQVGPGMSWDIDISSLPHQHNQTLFQDLPGGLSGLQHRTSMPWGCTAADTASPVSHLMCQQTVTLLKMGNKSKLFALLEHILLNRCSFPPFDNPDHVVDLVYATALEKSCTDLTEEDSGNDHDLCWNKKFHTKLPPRA